MRDSRNMINNIKNSYPDQYRFLKSKLLEKNEDGITEYILGQRNDYLNIYYRGMSMAQIKDTGNKMTCTMSKFYIEGRSDLKSPRNLKPFARKKFWVTLKPKLRNMFMEHDGKMRREGMPERIMNMNNSHKAEEWFL